MEPALSIVVGAYGHHRELPRTLQSLSPAMQRDVAGLAYDVLIADNGTPRPFAIDESAYGMPVRILRTEPAAASVSPARVLNETVARSTGAIVGMMIDGARIASPGIVGKAARAIARGERTIVATLGFHLGHKLQKQSTREGYDQAVEDRLLESVRWFENPYRLFDISVYAASSNRGWYEPIAESNALFMRRSLWEELGGFDERFATGGGGLVNLDLFSRAVSLPGCSVVTLVGEGTFHQVHGGISTNSPIDMYPQYDAEYERIRGVKFRRPSYISSYVGEVAER